jgi:predicted amidohydrolase YtcJ
VLIERGRIAAVRRPGELTAPVGALEWDGGGGLLLPGFHDHHIHLRAAAAAGGSLVLGPPEVANQSQLAAALGRQALSGGWVRAVGYDESVAGPLDRLRLDGWLRERPLRVQDRTGAWWFLNSRAVEELGLEDVSHPGLGRGEGGRPDGRLFRMDRWLAHRLGTSPPDLSGFSRWGASRGITGFTEAGPDASVEEAREWIRLVRDGTILQRLHILSPSGSLGEWDSLDWAPVTTGAVKLVLDDQALPSLEELVGRFSATHQQARPVAVHCVSRDQLFLVLAALEEAGPGPGGDRLEHGSIVPPEGVERLRRLGVAVVTNPSLLARRGDRYQQEVSPADRDHLYPAAALVAAGVTLAAGSDAPYGDPDPWTSVAAAVLRRTPAGKVLGPRERLGPEKALALFWSLPASLNHRRSLTVGEPADLIVLAPAEEEPTVHTTMVAGRVVYDISHAA